MKTKMKRNRIVLVLNLVVLLVAALGAVAQENSATPQLPVTSPPAGIAQPKDASPLLPVFQTPENVYSYNPLGKPDPFKPFINIEVASIKKQAQTASTTESIFPLQRASVESFKLVGIVGDSSRRVAVVEDAERKFYPIFVGTRIGLHEGKVAEILTDRIAVDELDGRQTKRIILKLRKNI